MGYRFLILNWSSLIRLALCPIIGRSCPRPGDSMTARRAVLLIIVIEAVFCAAVAKAGGNRPNLHFVEGGIVTWVDAFQIFALSVVAVAVYRARAAEDDSAGAAFWLVVAAGAIYLSRDESFEFH